MSHRNHASYDSVVKVTPQEAERNKRAMGKSEAAERDPRGHEPFVVEPPKEAPEAGSAPSEENKSDATSNDK